MRRTYWLFSCLFLVAALCAAQNAPQTPESKDPSAQTPTASQTAPPDAPSAAQSPSAQSPDAQSSSAQSPSANAKPDNQKSSTDSSSQMGNANASGTSNDRLFFALPNFLTLENAGRVPPMTTKQKFGAVARGTFDPIQIAWFGALAGIAQAENSEPGFGQGWAAYGKRFGAYAADGTIENFMVGAIFPTILSQDPRYFQSGHGSFMQRSGYAVSRAVITRNDNGKNGFNYSEVVGAALASAISTYSYHPGRTFNRIDPTTGEPLYWPSDRTLTNTASVWGSQVGYDTLTFVVKEFWPDIRRKILKHHSESAQH